VLQEKVYEPLGATRSETADVRIISATHRDLAALVDAGTFRQDLYYRIKVMAFELPPLRRRREDIPLLTQQFVSVFNAVQNKQVTGPSRDAMGVLMAYDYPGNVRKLQNIIEHAFVLLREGPIELVHLPGDIVPRTQPSMDGQKVQPMCSFTPTLAITPFAPSARESTAKPWPNRPTRCSWAYQSRFGA
jgi:transcriptional regulator with PAS, ATPase and Fis domain